MAAREIDGISRSQVDLAAGTLTVTFSGELDVRQIGRAVASTGHGLVIGPRQQEPALQGFVKFLFSRRGTTLTAVAGLVTLLGLAASALGVGPVATVTFAVAIVTGGIPILLLAVRELLRAHVLGINTLMVIAVVGAAVIHEWAEAAIVVTLFAIGEALEGFAADRARGALDGLLEMAPAVALRLMPNGDVQETGVDQLGVGERVLVRPGDRVSVDGVVLSGESSLDQSPITGESVPVAKHAGDAVFAGTVNGAGALEVKVSRLAAESTLSRMVSLVQEAQSRQAPVQRFIDRFARIYTPAVTVAAALVASVPPLLYGLPFWGESGWLMRSLQMLVIACPCALVISTPVSVVSAMTNAASNGVLIKGGRFLDALSRVKVFAFDKTGTLTEGKPVTTDVLHVCSCGHCDENCGLRHAAALEVQSSHPLARAISAEAAARQLELLPAQDVALLAGRGLEGTVNGSPVTVASHEHFDQHFPHEASICALADELAEQGKTVVLVQHDNMVCGLFGVADVARDTSSELVSALRGQGLHTAMLTGDSLPVAEEIGRMVGIDRVMAGLLPEDKMAAIARLANEHGAVAMVGDGVNDAPALARADVGIAMGAAGSDQAMETADIVLMGDDLSRIPFALALSRRTRRVIRANIVLALATKAAVFSLALLGLATLWMAIVADVGASVAVILNGLRLRRGGA